MKQRNDEDVVVDIWVPSANRCTTNFGAQLLGGESHIHNNLTKERATCVCCQDDI